MTLEELTLIENASIRAFLARHAGLLDGAVLDYGCGRQPYRDIVEAAGGAYTGYDRAELPANMSGVDVGAGLPLSYWWNAIICTQVIQFVPEPAEFLSDLRRALGTGGALLLTWPTNWPEVNDTDLHRFTAAGMGRLLADAGFKITSEFARRATWDMVDYDLAYGYGAVALV